MKATDRLDVFGCELDGISLIEASAGTGKTWNICVLYLRLLLERGLQVQDILVVTFTRAATGELRERIRSRIVEMLAHLQGDTNADAAFAGELLRSVEQKASLPQTLLVERLETAINFFDEAAIFTIHGFCQRTLTDTALETGSSYQLELIEDDRTLRMAAVADFWRKHIASQRLDPAFARYLRETKQSPERWAEVLRRVQAKPFATALWPDDPQAPALSNALPFDDAWAAAHAIWSDRRAEVLRTIREGLNQLHGRSYHPRSILDSAQRWDAILLQQTGSLFHLAPDDKAHLLTRLTLEKRTLRGKTAPSHPFFDAAQRLLEVSETLSAQCERHLLAVLRTMITISGEDLQRHKRRNNVVSYDDILFNTWDALCSGKQPRLAATLRRRYPAALIDEFQDTDPLQCGIFLRIYGDGSVPFFLVGDPKQAIYSFRNADIHAYLQAKAQVHRIASLGHNQRSVSGLVDACNALFSANPGAFIQAGIGYQPVQTGHRKRQPLIDPDDRALPSLLDTARDRTMASKADEADEADDPSHQDFDSQQHWPMRLWRLPRDRDGALLTRASAYQWAIGQTAQEISRLLTSAVLVEGRALRGGDIAVLVRSHAQGKAIKEALSQRGIASVELSQASVWQSAEAMELERNLRAILSAAEVGRRHSLLLGALSTSLLGLNATQVLACRADDIAITAWANRFVQYQADWRRHGFAFMFRRWLEQEQISARLLGHRDGERRLTNLLHLGELLQRASHESNSPETLLRWMRGQRTEPASSEDAQLRLESDRDLVQIVTIHKSKGLEYGLVFCPLLWDGFQSPETRAMPIEDREAEGGTIFDFRPDAADNATRKARQRAAAEAEGIRLIYVALTRAVHRCYLVVGSYRNARGAGNAVATDSQRSLLNWLAGGAGVDRSTWSAQTPEPESIEQAWRAIADRARGQIALFTPLPVTDRNPISIGRECTAQVSPTPAVSIPRNLDPGWYEGSFSSLTRGRGDESPKRSLDAADHDSISSDPRASGMDSKHIPPGLPATDILRFPRGPREGECIHAIFENIDFTDPSTWDPAIAKALDQFGLPADPVHQQMLRTLLGDVMATPLQDGLLLGEIPRHKRLNELAFKIRAPALRADEWNDWFATHRIAVPNLQFGLPPRYLQGFIDLIFQCGDRYYVLDWKSNHLGYTPQHYDREPIEAVMAEKGYHLQSVLYCVALHRYLRLRVPGYSYDRHMGGSLYCFVRGIRPDWRDSQGRALGVCAQRLPFETMNAFDRLLGVDTAQRQALP